MKRGDICPGKRLPPERTLARLLGVSRSTVVTAYSLLREEALVESRQGSGTYVSGAGPGRAHGRTEPAARTSPLFGALHEPIGSVIELTTTAAPPLEEALEAAAGLGPEDFSFLRGGSGYYPLGLPALRTAVAEYLTRSGLPSTSRQVLITTGAQQAIALTAAVYAGRGGAVVLEDPTFPGAIDAYRLAGSQLVPVSVDQHGVRVDELEEAVERLAAQLVYLVPTFHNPTGTVLSEPRRRQVARIAAEHGVPVVEDNTLADLSFGAKPPRPIASFTESGNVLTVGSLSKLFWGGLRVGWLRGQESVIARLSAWQTIHHLADSALSQLVAIRLLGIVDEASATRSAQLQLRLSEVSRALDHLLPTWEWQCPTGGLSLWVRAPDADCRELCQLALRFGVQLLPGTVMSPSGRFSAFVRVPYVEKPETLRSGIERLAMAWRAYTGDPERHPGTEASGYGPARSGLLTGR